MKRGQLTVLGVVGLVALIALSMLLAMPQEAPKKETQTGAPAEQAAPGAPELQQAAWVSASLARCEQECNARTDLDLSGISYCHARCEAAYP